MDRFKNAFQDVKWFFQDLGYDIKSRTVTVRYLVFAPLFLLFLVPVYLFFSAFVSSSPSVESKPVPSIVPSTGSDTPLSVIDPAEEPTEGEVDGLSPQRQVDVPNAYREYVESRTAPEVTRLEMENGRASVVATMVYALTEGDVKKYSVDSEAAIKNPDRYCKPNASKLMDVVDFYKSPVRKKLFKDDLFYETLGYAVVVVQTCNDSLAKWDYGYQFLLWVKDHYRVFETTFSKKVLADAAKKIRYGPKAVKSSPAPDRWDSRKVRVQFGVPHTPWADFEPTPVEPIAPPPTKPFTEEQTVVVNSNPWVWSGYLPPATKP